jgi:hypothetical protein
VELDAEQSGQLRGPSDDVQLIHHAQVAVASDEVVVDDAPSGGQCYKLL